MITRQPWRSIPSFRRALSQQIIKPRPVASVRPCEPPSSSGLPVTTAGVALRGSIGEVVHNPGHCLRVGADVGRGNIALRSKPFAQLGRVTAGDALDLGLRELARVADYAAPPAAAGKI